MTIPGVKVSEIVLEPITFIVSTHEVLREFRFGPHLLTARLDDVLRADVNLVAVGVRQRRVLVEGLHVYVVLVVAVQEVRQLDQVVDHVLGFPGEVVPARFPLSQDVRRRLRRDRGRPKGPVPRLDGLHIGLEHGRLVHFAVRAAAGDIGRSTTGTGRDDSFFRRFQNIRLSGRARLSLWGYHSMTTITR